MNELDSYLHKQSSVATGHLQAYAQTTDSEELHQFRVAMKKINAVAVFLCTFFPKAKKNKKRLKQIFRSAGFIREQELRLQWLRRYRLLLLAETSDLERTMQLFQAAFNQDFLSNEKQLHRSVKQLRLLAGTIRQHDLVDSVTRLKQTVVLQLEKVQPQEWHELRKQIKQMLYALHWLSPGDQLRLLPVKQVQSFDQLQEAIGAWHDLVDLKQWLSDEQFFLHTDPLVTKSFAKGWKRLQTSLLTAEKTVLHRLAQHRQRFK